MKRILKALALALALVCPLSAAMAEQPPVGGYTAQLERQALLSGMELRSEGSLAWGGLPLLDAQTNDMLESLLGALTFTARRQGQAPSGYLSLDMLLKAVSVLDLRMQAAGDVYYEQSNLLGGQTVAFTAEEFRTFAGRLSGRSGGAIPSAIGPLFPLAMRALSMAQTQTICVVKKSVSLIPLQP